jgi:hypothetical protein
LSNDGQYYVSAQFLTFASILPQVVDRYDAVIAANYEAYLAQVEGMLNAAQPTDFWLHLTELDAVFASLEIVP